MHIAEVMEMLLNQESKIRKLTVEIDALLTHAEVRRHLQGFIHRHYMMQTSRLHVMGLFEPIRKSPLSVYQVSECMVHLNAYYLNLRGILDNLAWMLQYSQGVLPGISEGGKKGITDVNLFGKRFLDSLDKLTPALGAFIRSRMKWSCDLAALRNPAAHRIPIYVPRSVLVSDTQKQAYEEIFTLDAEKPEAERASFRELHDKADRIGEFLPIMVLSHQDNRIEPRNILNQVSRDQIRYLSISRKVLGWF